MTSFSFQPTSEVLVNILSASSTYAKIKIEPIEAFVDASISRVSDNIWSASTENIPQSSSVPLEDHTAVLILSKGEFGKFLGSVDLGHIH